MMMVLVTLVSITIVVSVVKQQTEGIKADACCIRVSSCVAPA